MLINRRQFIKSLAALAVATGVSIPALSSAREPYVSMGSVVSHLGPAPGFMGAQAVDSVGDWDGTGFPVVLRTNSYPARKETYYDFDLIDFRSEVPSDFWKIGNNKAEYPNIHTYARMQRFGETKREAIINLNFSSSSQFLRDFC